MPFEKLTDVIDKLTNLSSTVFTDMENVRRPEFIQVLIESVPMLPAIKDFLDTSSQSADIGALKQQIVNVENIATMLKNAKEDGLGQPNDSDNSDD